MITALISRSKNCSVVIEYPISGKFHEFRDFVMAIFRNISFRQFGEFV